MRPMAYNIPSTPHFPFVYGRYTLSNWTIPYFATTMTLRDAAENLKLAAELVGHQSANWSLEELYQREVDWKRVEQKIVKYLEDTASPKFFNSLTIALMPLDAETGHFASLADRTWTPPQLDSPERFSRTLDVGPFRLGYWNPWEEIGESGSLTGELRWNTRQVFAVAIDGQHRLAAIQSFAEKNARAGDRLDNTSVPVILIVLQEQLGYRGGPPEEYVNVLRRLFIDLNKHAQRVSRARQILLDDIDPISRCVRSLVENRLEPGFGALQRTTPQLPLGLVDWHSEQAKFDTGPYITTILGIDWIIAQCLKTKSLSDYTDYKAIRKQLEAFRTGLQLTLESARERLEVAENATQTPFGYTDTDQVGELAQIVQAFGSIWSAPLVHLLSAFAPYSDLIAHRTRLRADTNEFATWYSLKCKFSEANGNGRAAAEYQSYVNQLQSQGELHLAAPMLERALREIDDYKSNRGLAFNVAFQRAYILGFVEFNGITAEHLEALEGDDDDYDIDSLLQFGEDADDDDELAAIEVEGNCCEAPAGTVEIEHVRKFVAALNDCLIKWPALLDVDAVCDGMAEDLLSDQFWLGSLRKAEGGVDFTQGASKRAADLVFLVAAMHVYDSIADPEDHSDFDEFIAAAMDADNKFMGRVKRAVLRLSRKPASVGGRILSARGVEFDFDTSRAEIEARLRFVWNTLEL